MSSPEVETADAVGRVIATVRAHRYLAVDEAALQEQLAGVLSRHHVPYQREVSLAPYGRIDFLLDGGVGLEVKVEGSVSAVLRQLFGYAQSPAITVLVLVTRRVQLAQLRGPLLTKPLHVVHVTGGLL